MGADDTSELRAPNAPPPYRGEKPTANWKTILGPRLHARLSGELTRFNNAELTAKGLRAAVIEACSREGIDPSLGLAWLTQPRPPQSAEGLSTQVHVPPQGLPNQPPTSPMARPRIVQPPPPMAPPAPLYEPAAPPAAVPPWAPAQGTWPPVWGNPQGPPPPSGISGIPYAPARPPRKRRRPWGWVAVAGLLVIVIAVVVGFSGNKGKANTASTTSPAVAEPSAIASAPAVPQPTPIPTPTPSPTPSPPPPSPVTLLSIQGSGIQTTEKFTTTSDDWDMAYLYDCSSFIGGTGNFIVNIYNGDGSLDDIGANELGAGALKIQHFHQGGTFYLSINSECNWTVKVTDTQ
jgi:hypothetical protein